MLHICRASAILWDDIAECIDVSDHSGAWDTFVAYLNFTSENCPLAAPVEPRKFHSFAAHCSYSGIYGFMAAFVCYTYTCNTKIVWLHNLAENAVLLQE